jgi:hypothetical protein
MSFDTRQQRRHCKQKQQMCTLSRAPQSPSRRQAVHVVRDPQLCRRGFSALAARCSACCLCCRTRADDHCSHAIMTDVNAVRGTHTLHTLSRCDTLRKLCRWSFSVTQRADPPLWLSVCCVRVSLRPVDSTRHRMVQCIFSDIFCTRTSVRMFVCFLCVRSPLPLPLHLRPLPLPPLLPSRRSRR